MGDPSEEHLAERAAACERVCDAALLTGDCGVLQIELDDGGVRFEVSSRVPYGVIAVVSERNIPCASD